MTLAPKCWRTSVLVLAGWAALSFSVVQSQETPEAARKVVSQRPPQYPNLARTAHISGSVRLDAVVAPNGSVKVVEIKGGHPVLALAAQAAVKDWKYEAGPRETHENVEVKFNPQ
jgi:TonB family protein